MSEEPENRSLIEVAEQDPILIEVGIPKEEENEMPRDTEGNLQVDPTIEKVLDESFASRHERLSQTAERFNDGSAFAAQESKQRFGLQQMLLGATAQNMLEKHGLGDMIAQMKMAGSFPPNQFGASTPA